VSETVQCEIESNNKTTHNMQVD